MRSNTRMLLSLSLLVAIAGCGGSGDSAPNEADDEAAAARANTPEAAVADFLEAIRVGDDETAASMFTPLARERVAQLGIQVAPQGSDTARFSLGAVEQLTEDGARVAASWTDLDETGKPRTDEMTWMVRREPEGWRVAGMATVVFPGEPPLLLDFEKPQETLKKLELVRQEIARRAQTATALPSDRPNPEDSIRR